MKILLLASQPFYQERGTPIAVDRLVNVLSREGAEIDMITYHEGQDRVYDQVTIYRTSGLGFVRNIRPGFSWKKLVSNLLMLVIAFQLAGRNRYQLVHAVEDAVFIALLLKLFFKIPYVYDMDSSMAQQLVEAKPALGRFARVLHWFEGLAVRQAKVVVPVCDALVQAAALHRPRKVVLLPDVSLLEPPRPGFVEDLRTTNNISGVMLMYVGNLEPYQGIDLLIESFAQVRAQNDQAELVIIGGDQNRIAFYTERCREYEIAPYVHFLGSRPLDLLSTYLAQADILVSPRIKGNNTPMKIYSYLDSGKALVATDLPTHTQVLNHQVAVLAQPEPAAFAAGLLALLEDAELRAEYGAAGKELIRTNYTLAAFTERVRSLYDWLQAELGDDQDRSDGTMTRAAAA